MSAANITAKTPGIKRILFALLNHGPMTYKEIALHACLSGKSISNTSYMRCAHNLQLVHICDWQRGKNGGNPLPVWKTSCNTDAPKPEPLPKVELNRRANKKRAPPLHRPLVDPVIQALIGSWK